MILKEQVITLPDILILVVEHLIMEHTHCMNRDDVKIMAHAEADKADWYITFDTDSKKLYDTLKQRGMIKFRFIDANQPVSVYTGEIPLEFDEDAHT